MLGAFRWSAPRPCNASEHALGPFCCLWAAGTLPPPPSLWRVFNNYCVSVIGQNLPETKTDAGNASIDACKKLCHQNTACSAIEWYAAGNGGTKCFLQLRQPPAAKKASGNRYKDATCHVKPVAHIGVAKKGSADVTGWSVPVGSVRRVGTRGRGWAFVRNGGCHASTTSKNANLGASWNNGGRSAEWCQAQAEAAGATYIVYLSSTQAGARQGGCAWYGASVTDCEKAGICVSNGVDTTAAWGCQVYKIPGARGPAAAATHFVELPGATMAPLPRALGRPLPASSATARRARSRRCAQLALSEHCSSVRQ